MTSTTTNDYDYLIKILLAGDVGSGRSCFLLRYSEGTFPEGYFPTIGVDFKIKTLVSPDTQKKLKLQIWDAAGRERFRQITSAYYRGSMGIMLMFDVTDRASFVGITRYVEDISRYSVPHVQKVLVATKMDQADKRQVSHEEAKELAEHLGIPYFETSAKDNSHVTEAVDALLRLVEANYAQIVSEIGEVKKTSAHRPAASGTRRCILM